MRVYVKYKCIVCIYTDYTVDHCLIYNLLYLPTYLLQTRISQEQEHFLWNPYGLLFNEVTAASLLKVDMQAEIVDTGSTRLTINKKHFHIHAAIHASRPDIKSIIHLRNNAVVSVSKMYAVFR